MEEEIHIAVIALREEFRYFIEQTGQSFKDNSSSPFIWYRKIKTIKNIPISGIILYGNYEGSNPNYKELRQYVRENYSNLLIDAVFRSSEVEFFKHFNFGVQLAPYLSK